jgi:hypothetical protein
MRKATRVIRDSAGQCDKQDGLLERSTAVIVRWTGKEILNIRAISEFGKALLPSGGEKDTRQRGRFGQSQLYLRSMPRRTVSSPNGIECMFCERRVKQGEI